MLELVGDGGDDPGGDWFGKPGELPIRVALVPPDAAVLVHSEVEGSEDESEGVQILTNAAGQVRRGISECVRQGVVVPPSIQAGGAVDSHGEHFLADGYHSEICHGRAGNTGNYPRWREDHPRPADPSHTTPELPLLARGPLIGFAVQARFRRTTPADAGTTCRSPRRRRRDANYPRWRRDHVIGLSIIIIAIELPPLARGPYGEPAHRLLAERTTPAGAGPRGVTAPSPRPRGTTPAGAGTTPGSGRRRPPCCAATFTVKARRARAAGPSVRWCPGLGATVVERAAERSGRGVGAWCWQVAPFLEYLVCGVVAGQASLLG